MAKEQEKIVSDPELIFGLEGLAAFYHIGRTKASRLNNSGKIDSARILSGRKLVFRKDILLTLNL